MVVVIVLVALAALCVIPAVPIAVAAYRDPARGAVLDDRGLAREVFGA